MKISNIRGEQLHFANAFVYRHVREALENVEIVLREANDYPDIKDKGQRIAEVSAGKRLLESVRVSVEVVKVLLLRPLLYLSKKFVDTVIGVAARITKGKPLTTLRDAALYITKLSKAEHDAEEWQAAMEALILVAESGGPTMFARIGIMRALNRHVERVFDSSRKDPHWGRRKLARDR